MTNETFEIKGDYIELIKLLKAANLCESGGIAKMLVEDGIIQVNGNTEYRKRCKLRPGDKVVFQDNCIEIL
jgi:ribosome-associated protein